MKKILRFSSNYVSLIPLTIFLFKLLVLRTDLIPASSSRLTSFVTDFIGWVGVLYAILVIITLVKVWEQLDRIDREFDREADTVRILYEETLLLKNEYAPLKEGIVQLLLYYVEHVLNNYALEANYMGEEKRLGDTLIYRIRRLYKNVIESEEGKSTTSEPLVTELIHRVNELADIRGDRIALSRQRLFESVRMIVLVISILFIVPFYYLGFNPQSSLLENLLIAGITLVVIFIFLVIEDLDEPFAGTWKINTDSWQSVYEDIRIGIEDQNKRMKKADLIRKR